MPVEIPPDKILLYAICDFLIAKKLDYPAGIGIKRPLPIPLQEFAGAVIHRKPPTEKDLTRLKDELLGMRAENGLLTVRNPNIFRRFSNNYRANSPIVLVYTRDAVDKYKKQLLTGDRIRYVGTAVRFDSAEQMFYYRDHQMRVLTGTRGVPVRLYLATLMFGGKIPSPTNPVETINLRHESPHYRIGQRIEYDILYDLLYDRRESDGKPIKKWFAAIDDAVRGLNERAITELGRPIFYSHAQQVSVIR